MLVSRPEEMLQVNLECAEDDIAQEVEQEKDVVVNMGPQHPSTHGVLRLIVRLDGETVVSVKPDIGYLHRCFEKLAENKAYPGVMGFTDRTDYLSAMYNEWCYAMAVERLMDMEIPERAQYMRVIVGEMQRVLSHLMWVGAFAADLGAFSLFMYAFREREKVYDLFEYLTGGRLLYNYFRIGGLRNDFPPGWTDRVLEVCDYMEKKALPEYDRLLTGNRIFEVRTQGIGKLRKEDAIAWGATGVMLRSAGVQWDLRRDDPYGIYDRFEFEIPVGHDGGDVYTRHTLRMEEMRQSIKIVRQAIAQLPEGEFIHPKVPKTIRPPAGEIYMRVEAPRGEVGCLLVSDGSPKPYRLHWRSPAFTHLQLLDVMSVGEKLADLVASLGSIDLVLGEVDR